MIPIWSFDRRARIPHAEARARAQRLVDGRILVGHALWNDLDVLGMEHPRQLIVDTALHMRLRLI